MRHRQLRSATSACSLHAADREIARFSPVLSWLCGAFFFALPTASFIAFAFGPRHTK